MNVRSLTLYSAALLGAEYVLLGVFGLVMLFGSDFVSMVDASAPAPKQEILWAPVYVPKPSTAPTQIAIEPPADVPKSTETPAPTVEIIEEAPVMEEPHREPAGERWIDVNLSAQQIYAYEGDVVVNAFTVSTGVYDTPTVTGEYNIYVKVPMQPMSGPGYYLPDVPWVMFFYDEYGFHGTYWHDNFGTPMSRGCVNLRTEDAEWLYHWASVGTRVVVHY